MSDLKQMIKNEFDKDRGLSKKITQIAGFKNPTPLYKFLNEPSRELANFNSLLLIVEHLFPERKFELIEEYLLSVDPNKSTARCGLEFAKINRLDNLTEVLMDKLLDSKNNESIEWGNIYELETKAYQDESKNIEVVSTLNTYNYKTKEMSIYGKLVILYKYFEFRAFPQMMPLIKLVEGEIELIKDEFIKNSFMCRLGLVVTCVSLHIGDLANARKYATETIERTTKKSLTTNMLVHLGNSYLFESYDKAIEHFHKAMEYCSNPQRLIEIKRSLNFTNSYWDKTPEYLDYDSEITSDKHEVAFHFIKTGKTDDALRVLDSINLDEVNDNTKGFHYFYRGLLTNQEDYFYLSVRHFNLSGEKFYRKLPLIELEKKGVNKYALLAYEI